MSACVNGTCVDPTCRCRASQRSFLPNTSQMSQMYPFNFQGYPTDFNSWVGAQSTANWYNPNPRLAAATQFATPSLGFNFVANTINFPSNGGKIRKKRNLFNQHQLTELERAFKSNKYLTPQDRENLARMINLLPSQVKIWFQNQRYKQKKINKEQGLESSSNSLSEPSASPNSNTSGTESPQAKTEDDLVKPELPLEVPPPPMSNSFPQMYPQCYPPQNVPYGGFGPYGGYS